MYTQSFGSHVQPAICIMQAQQRDSCNREGDETKTLALYICILNTHKLYDVS